MQVSYIVGNNAALCLGFREGTRLKVIKCFFHSMPLILLYKASPPQHHKPITSFTRQTLILLLFLGTSTLSEISKILNCKSRVPTGLVDAQMVRRIVELGYWAFLVFSCKYIFLIFFPQQQFLFLCLFQICLEGSSS